MRRPFSFVPWMEKQGSKRTVHNKEEREEEEEEEERELQESEVSSAERRLCTET